MLGFLFALLQRGVLESCGVPAHGGVRPGCGPLRLKKNTFLSVWGPSRRMPRTSAPEHFAVRSTPPSPAEHMCCGRRARPSAHVWCGKTIWGMPGGTGSPTVCHLFSVPLSHPQPRGRALECPPRQAAPEVGLRALGCRGRASISGQVGWSRTPLRPGGGGRGGTPPHLNPVNSHYIEPCQVVATSRHQGQSVRGCIPGQCGDPWKLRPVVRSRQHADLCLQLAVIQGEPKTGAGGAPPGTDSWQKTKCTPSSEE